MRYKNIVEGIFIKRLNRFIAIVLIDGKSEQVHVKNTGRCQELFIEGVKVYLEKSDNPNRKTGYSLISIYKGDVLVNIDSQVPNQVIYEALLRGEIKEIGQVSYAVREVTYGSSRFDIYYEKGDEKGYIEVKGVTLEEMGLALFPDAPTIRGTKHINELTKALNEGYKNYVCFLIQIENIHKFRPHHERDRAFADSLFNAIDKGLGVLVYNSKLSRDTIELGYSGSLVNQTW
ncbi:DNA/RNA nuclease SfsA [Petrocella sp. FN5]|uniref:DNA/RNA nuclease SfsA n=1 Tax=Petrocella sp. FN5 TaxID=3032002 RepID=UPI0023DA378A|nr:DNA/RNA nuclease SfsA [Petrocella sp. FN5]MDF1618152.1 DNA/RNA nuclease SfsA [Petrocella sp. FN5]